MVLTLLIGLLIVTVQHITSNEVKNDRAQLRKRIFNWTLEHNIVYNRHIRCTLDSCTFLVAPDKPSITVRCLPEFCYIKGN